MGLFDNFKLLLLIVCLFSLFSCKSAQRFSDRPGVSSAIEATIGVPFEITGRVLEGVTGNLRSATEIPESEWIKDKVSGCKMANPFYSGGNPNGFIKGGTISWSGSCVNGFLSGKGILQWYNKNTAKYEGNMSNGVISGYGVYRFNNGDIYKGDFIDGMFSGKGVYTLSNGESYSGNWEFNQKNGQVIYTSKNGDKYKEYWSRGKKERSESFIEIARKEEAAKQEAEKKKRDEDHKKKISDLYTQAYNEANNFNCEESLSIEQQIHKEEGSNGDNTIYADCIKEKKFNSMLKSGNPQAMHLMAGSYERDGSNYHAKKLYDAIISRFPNSDWALAANDRLLNISADENESRRQNEFEFNRAREARKASEDCSHQISACNMGCSDIKDWSSRSSCQSSCYSICTP